MAGFLCGDPIRSDFLQRWGKNRQERNNDSRSVWKPVADAAEKKHGKIDVSGFDLMRQRDTNAANAFKKLKK